MNEKTVGFIGGGRIARIILGGWQRAGKLPDSMVVSDTNEAALTALKKQHESVRTAANDNKEAASQQIVFIAVHPPAIPAVLGEIKASLTPSTLLVSLAPKFTLARLRELLGGFERIARVIPNAPSFVGAGYNPVAFSAGVGVEDRQTLMALLSPLGDCPEVAEEKLEGFALLTGMGPTYLWFQLQTLRELAAEFGLADADVAPALKQMVCGSARTLLESGLSPAEVMDLVPVKPLADQETVISQIYQHRLPALFAKIKP